VASRNKFPIVPVFPIETLLRHLSERLSPRFSVAADLPVLGFAAAVLRPFLLEAVKESET